VRSELGARRGQDQTTFRVYTTTAERVALRAFAADGKTVLRTVPMEKRDGGIFEVSLPNGDVEHYKFVLDDDEVPDPYARFLPFGVHGPARVTESKHEPALASPPPLHRWVIYELHVGTFTEGGTYRAAIERLDHLVDLGVTAVELLPVHAFDGARGWGYDGVALYAPFAPYGEPDDLRALVRALHERGLCAILDVVYNHFGPSGNYLSRYSPTYFTTDVDTPWGKGPAFAEEHLRSLVVENARYWLEEFGFDGLRLDATHAIHDPSPKHVLREITDLAHALEPRRRVFFEDERNEPAVIRELGADGVWADDLHHQIHVQLTGERDGYYAAYEPTTTELAKTIERGWRYIGEPYAPWKDKPEKNRGKDPGDLAYEHFVTCIQNHDQVGNRALGTRLSAHVDAEAFCAAVVVLLFLPTTPLLFMGQEWMASTPFLFFSDHEGALGESVRRGRREEFKAFAAFADPEVRAKIPDPQVESTFEASKLRWTERSEAAHARAFDIHRAMLRLRKEDAVLSAPCRREDLVVHERNGVLEVTRSSRGGSRVLVANFTDEPASVSLSPEWAPVVTAGSFSEARIGAKTAVVFART
jgi:maltooligosyltrehalose trehalohydrolase